MDENKDKLNQNVVNEDLAKQILDETQKPRDIQEEIRLHEKLAKKKTFITIMSLLVLTVVMTAIALLVGLAPTFIDAPKYIVQILIVFIAIIVVAVAVVLLIRNQKKAQEIARKVKDGLIEDPKKAVSAADNLLFDAYGIGTKALILKGVGYYQVIKENEGFYFVFCGNEIVGVNYKLMMTSAQKKEDYLLHKKSFFLYKGDVQKIVISNASAAYNLNCVYVTFISNNNAKRKMWLKNTENKFNLAEFFKDYTLEDRLKPKKNLNEADKEVSEQDVQLAGRLRIIGYLLVAAETILSIIFLFLNVNYFILSLLLMLCFVAMLILYFVFGHIFSLTSVPNKGLKTKVNAMTPFIIPSAVLAMRSLLDFQYANFKNLLIVAAIALAVLMALFVLFSKEFRKKRSSVFIFLMCALFFAPSFTAQANYIFDSSKPQLTSTIILDMHEEKSSNSPDSFYVTVSFESKEIDIDVGEECYARVKKGDNITIYLYKGFFKIPYIFADDGNDYD